MKDAILYIKEQIKYFRIAVNLSKYSTKSTSMQNRLGRLWEILDPLVQLAINYLIFGILMHRVVPGYPALPWMFIGLGVYGFSKNVIVQGSKSISTQFKVSSKMSYPVSIMPLTTSLGFLTEFYIMVGGGILLAINAGYPPTLYWLQFFYYFPALLIFSLSFSLLNSTIIVIFPDYKFFLNYIFRFLMYVSGAIFSLQQFKQIPQFILQAQIINPFYYLIEGFRDIAFGREWFWDKGMYAVSFWAITILILIIGANAHMKIRDRISDYL
ncbi:Teichoic acid translocation permease protein TagG [Lactococcus lactis subsp. lactis]|uniref:Teichoic acid translocation permease protein TagG n=1 Tax=Lactococcus lactis subsp. lactis TaxID=1360 RepID=A0A0V8E173_LACLL|nr:ABC transporter permease [Lactococcus lactis]KSU19570.1 Teichoic acid translocation permease protein TagG [Lactococcus lactis subsp. lactis]MBU5242322.1 ABC transporter permease [Lactococcus lactis]MDR7696815.1 ABC transporter permease [Lactococcus lactis]MDT2910304.1 ABC transporter permease [Lactococcus lactis]MDT2917941.1 ABC transporter permease [Lactococcus lactis]